MTANRLLDSCDGQRLMISGYLLPATTNEQPAEAASAYAVAELSADAGLTLKVACSLLDLAAAVQPFRRELTEFGKGYTARLPALCQLELESVSDESNYLLNYYYLY